MLLKFCYIFFSRYTWAYSKHQLYYNDCNDKQVIFVMSKILHSKIAIGTIAKAQNACSSEYLFFAKQASWVLKNKSFCQKPTYSKETTVLCESIYAKNHSNVSDFCFQ